MNRIKQLFETKHKGILSVYFCAGAPTLEGTRDTLTALQQGGVDMVEVGIPFSDPLADGPTIQGASTKALHNGMTLHKLMDQLEGMRPQLTLPVIMMGYLTPILHYGIEAFCERCREVGVDGLIIPDLPFEQYEADFQPIVSKYGLEFIFLITPETSESRIRTIDAHSDGFIYAVSSASVTGAQGSFSEAKQAYFARLEAMKLRNPLLVGFGISNLATRSAADAHTAGVIVGSKFVTLLEQSSSPAEAVKALLKALAS